MRLLPVIVPGWKNSGAGHWQTHWEATLPRAVRVHQSNWYTPDRTQWVAGLASAIDAAARPPLLIAHSLGCITVAHLPVPLRARVAGALLVAPADVERDNAPECLRNFGPIPRNPLPFPSVVVASTNDPSCSLARAQDFAAAWGSRLITLDNAGHINPESGFGPWPEGLKLLAALRRRARWKVPVAPERVPAIIWPSLT